ncbi:protein-methionine-sulfoxide reductase heme-binding subunit MsrQ [Novimethylophilus kurashikiensis]|uniref:Protein-methionine-sulfoxide reductase heme-binding subunit MsrQ n=1 Tax=Novimethylophilus kurashikiensis TaxID=1825523 RepID=A0A2R5F1Q5_9PROT|nr:YqiA/YcfP family alpha/beta fold hydrolase [Novimethylophilus kurashikiensis]GBG12610.1 protein-methionine-sulfoxide reductase heme-binding subunit MsrQ [Novimethylophilus kurashikiensis]
MNNTLFYLPGFNSGPQSEKSAQLKHAFPQLIVADYNTWDPDQGFQTLEALVTPHLDRKPVLIGSSLGGFWSYYLACRHSLSCVLLNPCMAPENTLRPYIGAVQNRYSGATGWLHEEDLQKYARYRFPGRPPCTVLHEKGDELIPYQESITNFEHKAELILLEGGSHRFESVPRAIEEIQKMLDMCLNAP